MSRGPRSTGARTGSTCSGAWLRRWATGWPPAGSVLVEVSPTQAPLTAELFRASGLRAEIHESADEATVVCGEAVH